MASASAASTRTPEAQLADGLRREPVPFAEVPVEVDPASLYRPARSGHLLDLVIIEGLVYGD